MRLIEIIDRAAAVDVVDIAATLYDLAVSTISGILFGARRHGLFFNVTTCTHGQHGLFFYVTTHFT